MSSIGFAVVVIIGLWILGQIAKACKKEKPATPPRELSATEKKAQMAGQILRSNVQDTAVVVKGAANVAKAFFDGLREAGK
jgi:hypothetical protein